MSGSQDNIDNRRLERGSRNRRYSPSSTATGGSLTINGSALFNLVLCIFAVLAFGYAMQANERSERAMDQAALMERETRVMEDDLKFIRSYLSARGINVPANHEEAEEKQ